MNHVQSTPGHQATEGQADGVSFDALWARFDTLLDRLGRTAASETIVDTGDLLTRLLDLIIDQVLPRFESDPKRLREKAQQTLSRLDRRYHAIGADNTLEQGRLERELFALQTQIWALHPIFSVLKDEPWNLYRDLLAHLQILEQSLCDALARRREEPPDLKALRTLRMELLLHQLDSYLLSARAILEAPITMQAGALLDQDADALWERIQYGERLQLALLGEAMQIFGEGPFLSLLDTDADEADSTHSDASRRFADGLEQLAQVQTAMVERSVELIKGMPGWQSRKWLGARSVELSDFADEILTNSDTRFLSLEAYSVHRAYLYIRRFRIEFLTERRLRIAADFKHLLKLERQLKSEWVEKTVSLRLTRRFGDQFETRLDYAVLALVVLAVGVLTLELNLELSSAAQHLAVWVDTIICTGLLADFLLRIRCAPDRADYLRRHWLTDLLPAIPFGALALALEALIIEAQSITLLKALRIISVSLRKARPIIKLMRIVLFAARGMDRLARRYRHLLNWDILFFEPARRAPNEQALMRFDQVRNRIEFDRKRLLEQHSDKDRVIRERDLAFLQQQFRTLEQRHRRPTAITINARQADLRQTRSRRISVEEVIERLLVIDAETLSEKLGTDFPRRIAKLVWIAQLPPLRWLPFFSDVLHARQIAQKDDLAFSEQLVRRMGKRLQWLNEKALFVADMHGVITAPQLIDRVGTTLVNSMRRPRNRLLMLGGGFIVATLLVEVLPFDWLEAAATWLRKTLGWPILALGIFALIAVWFGTKLRDLAQTNTDFHTRIAEAKSLGLLNEIKRDRANHDQEVLKRRVLKPEARIQAIPPADNGALESSLGTAECFSHLVRQVFGQQRHNGIGSLAERVYLLYREYLRGAPFHLSNTGTTDQLLGNPSLFNIRYRILRLGKEEQAMLDTLDLRRTTGIGGPSLWLRFITSAITQNTGQLVEEYNRHVIPSRERDHQVRDADEIAQYRSWINDRRNRARGMHSRCNEGAGSSAHYATTAFTALDFLSNDPRREAAIREHFGSEIADLVAMDRKRLIRRVFGIELTHKRKLTERSINPYRLYSRYLAHGRVFLLPLTLIGLLLRLIGFAWRSFWKTLDELRNPQNHCAEIEEESLSDFSVALRKIHRMCKPVFLASTELRARVDVEYLGLPLPGEPLTEMEGAGYIDDLDLIGATPRERAPFQALSGEHRLAMGELSCLLEQEDGWLSTFLLRLFPDHPDHRRKEVLRTLSIAYVANFQDLRDLVQSEARLTAVVAEAVAQQGRLTGLQGGISRLIQMPRRLQRARKETRQFEIWWERQGAGLIPAGSTQAQPRGYTERWWRYDIQGMGHLIRLTVEAEFQPLEKARQLMEQVIRNTTSWTEQLVTLRTIQTLSILDIESSKHIVRNLGEYEDTKEEVATVRIPTL